MSTSPPMFRRTSRATVAALAVGVAASFASAANIPYAETFDDDALNNATPSEPAPENGTFTPVHRTVGGDADTSSSTTWAVRADSPGRDYELDTSVTSEASGFVAQQSASELTFSGLADNPFAIASDFEVDSVSSVQNSFVGLFARNTGAGPGGFPTSGDGVAYQLRYFTSGPNVGKLVLVGSGFSNTTSTGSLTVDATGATTYSISLEGAILGDGSVALTGTLSDGSSTIDVTATDDGADGVLGGDGFGLLGQVQANDVTDTQTSTLNVDFDNLTVIPEPASVGLAGLGALAMLKRRRKAPASA